MFFKEKEDDKKYYIDYLLEKYGKLGLSRKETAKEIGISLSQLDKLLKVGTGLPNYKRLGKSEKSRIIFPVNEIADFLTIAA